EARGRGRASRVARASQSAFSVQCIDDDRLLDSNSARTRSRNADAPVGFVTRCASRSEEHTSELQSRFDLVCRLLLEKKKTETQLPPAPPARLEVPVTLAAHVSGLDVLGAPPGRLADAAPALIAAALADAASFDRPVL